MSRSPCLLIGQGQEITLLTEKQSGNLNLGCNCLELLRNLPAQHLKIWGYWNIIEPPSGARKPIVLWEA
jgi:hypothetical protein